VLRRLFGPKREEVAGGWRRLHNEELHSLYRSPDVVKMTKSKRDVAYSAHGTDEKFIRDFGRKA